ncbi:MAG: DNA alkylation repair protein [Corynebacterium sp.]|nr:DNA alkylation repair protein [Corynebacterium sp.]
MTAHRELINDIRTTLPQYADTERAAQQQRYLKTDEAMLGLRIPELRKLIQTATRSHAPQGLKRTELLDTARELWDEATHREYRRGAIILLLLPKHAKLLDSTAMDLVEHFVRTGEWWDLVDECVHTHNHVRANVGITGAELEHQRMLDWAQDPSVWIRRYAILCQLQAKGHTDTQLLAQVIELNLGEKEFFIAKAIGWALRDYGRTNPQWVRDFIASHPTMQPLSVREASKHL